MNPALSIDSLSIRYIAQGEFPAVDNISLEIGSGEIVGLVGESGCGKSTLAGAVLGILDQAQVTAKEFRLENTDLLNLDESQLCAIRGRNVSLVFQDPQSALDPVFTIGRQLAEVMLRHGVADRKNVNLLAAKALQDLHLPDVDRILKSYPHQLSGGMRQRVLIAMAMACGPALLIADEPTSALDVSTQARILELLAGIGNTHQTGILLITHDLAVAASICHRILVMHQGKIVESGNTAEILHNPAHPYTRRLLDAAPGSGTPRERDPVSAGNTIMELSDHHVSHIIGKRRNKRNIVAVDGVNLEIHGGEILALVGESGCGKSTLAQSMIGLRNSKSESVRFKGESISHRDRKTWSDLRRRVQLVFQDSKAALSPRRTVAQTLREPLDHYQIGSPNERDEKVRDLMQRVGLDPALASRRPLELSGGQRQRVSLARALISEPELLIADEPMSALDVSTQANVIELLLQLRREKGFAMLIVSHDLAVVREIADRIAVMENGKIVETAPTEQIFENPGHPCTRSLLAAIPTSEFTAA